MACDQFFEARVSYHETPTQTKEFGMKNIIIIDKKGFFWLYYFLNLKAFNITVILLNTIAKLAIIGFIEIPIGFNIPIATGIIKQL